VGVGQRGSSRRNRHGFGRLQCRLRDRFVTDGGLQPLVVDALVGRVLVDDKKLIAVLTEQIEFPKASDNAQIGEGVAAVDGVECGRQIGRGRLGLSGIGRREHAVDGGFDGGFDGVAVAKSDALFRGVDVRVNT